MNATDEWDEGRIHAYVDGELDAFTAARLEAACRRDAQLDARVQSQRRLRAALRAQFDPVLQEAVPARLAKAAAMTPAPNVTPIASARPRSPRVQPVWLGALAASLVIGLAIVWLAPRDSGLPIAPHGNGLVATGHLDAALSRSLSTDGRDASGVQVAISIATADGGFCRSFSLASGADGLACRRDGQWQVEALGQGLAPQSGTEYRQAGSPLSAVALGAIGERQSGDVLTVDQERQQREAGWVGLAATR